MLVSEVEKQPVQNACVKHYMLKDSWSCCKRNTTVQVPTAFKLISGDAQECEAEQSFLLWTALQGHYS